MSPGNGSIPLLNVGGPAGVPAGRAAVPGVLKVGPPARKGRGGDPRRRERYELPRAVAHLLPHLAGRRGLRRVGCHGGDR